MKMRKQRCMGLVLVLLSLLVVKMASTGTTPEDSDATVTVLLGPLGIYMMVTKQYILYDGEEANSEPNTEEEQKGVKALREIAEAELALGDNEAELNRQIIGAKKVAEQESKPYADRISKLERDVKEFVTDHRDELGKAKSRSLNFGEVGFRLSTTISVPKAKEKVAEIVRRLKARQMTDCIIVKEKISKDALRKYGEDTVNAVGATWKQKDTFGYEVFKDKVERTSSPGL